MAVTFDHGGGVRSVRVPIPDNPLGHTLVYVVDTDRGPVLIDTGWDDPGSWGTLVAGLAACGAAVGEVHGVVITHHHPDHHGLSARVRAASGALGGAARGRRGDRAPGAGDPAGALAVVHGGQLTAAGALRHVAPLRSPRARSLPGLSPPRPARPGDRPRRTPQPARPPAARRSGPPGTRRGHVCLHLEEEHPARLPGHGRLFSGDHLLPEITPHIPACTRTRTTRPSPIPWATTSTPWSGSAGSPPPRSSRPTSTPSPTPRPGCARCSTTTRAGCPTSSPCSPRPLTPWRLAERMDWNRPWSDIPYGSRTIAVSEAESHLRRLVKQGRAEPVPGSGAGGVRGGVSPQWRSAATRPGNGRLRRGR
ncbi:MBL fold metallo-hydrolase [Streptomyces tricolor]|nr:MBL fold metallo-hydrolase [Streptomyces tricolor]